MRSLFIATLTAFAATNVQAAIFAPAQVKMTDGFSVVPQIATSIIYNDNIYTNESNAVSSSIYLINPSISFGGDDGINRYGGEYELLSGTYSEGSADNYLDHNLTLYAHSEYTHKHRSDFNVAFHNLHEERGSNSTETNQYSYSEPLKYNTVFTRGYYQYGAKTAIMNIGGGLQFDTRNYQNFTDDTKYDDLSTWTLLLDADYRIGNVTYLTADFSSANVAYTYKRFGQVSQDNTDRRLLVGLRWAGMGKTVGNIQIGYQSKMFDDARRDDFTGNTVDIGLEWQPVMRATFELHLSHAAEDPDYVSNTDYIEVLSSSLGWSHDWSEKFNSRLQLTFSSDDYVGINRKDDATIIGFDLTYDFTRWLRMEMGYESIDNNSNYPNIGYDRSVTSLGFVVSL